MDWPEIEFYLFSFSCYISFVLIKIFCLAYYPQNKNLYKCCHLVQEMSNIQYNGQKITNYLWHTCFFLSALNFCLMGRVGESHQFHSDIWWVLFVSSLVDSRWFSLKSIQNHLGIELLFNFHNCLGLFQSSVVAIGNVK